MTISAKFKVQQVTPHISGEKFDDDRDYAEVLLVPDYAGGRNADWARYTPSGSIRMNVSRGTALTRFKVGQAFTVLFEENNE